MSRDVVEWCQTQECLSLASKVVVAGSYATGKTSLIERYARGQYTADYKATVGVDFSHVKYRALDGSHEFSLSIWDTAGQVSSPLSFSFETKTSSASISRLTINRMTMIDDDAGKIPVCNQGLLQRSICDIIVLLC